MPYKCDFCKSFILSFEDFLRTLHANPLPYPNDIVLMAIHSGSGSSVDPMQNSVFNTVISGHSFPSADVNR